MSGNPVRIRDGCATVTATIPNATVRKDGKAGKGLKPKSGYRFDCARQPRTFRGTSPQREGWSQPADLFSAGLVECLHSPFCRSLEVFLSLKSSDTALVFQIKYVLPKMQ